MNNVFQIKVEPLADGKGNIRGHLRLPDEGFTRLDTYTRPFGVNARMIINSLDVDMNAIGFSWAILCFPQEYELAGHVAALRGMKANILFSSYKGIYRCLEAIPHPPAPPLSMLFIHCHPIDKNENVGKRL